MNMFLKKGWTPLGGVAVAPDAGRFYFLQSVVAESDHAEVPVTGPAWELEAKALCAAGKKIDAIKVVREHTGLGLQEAKYLVESWNLG